MYWNRRIAILLTVVSLWCWSTAEACALVDVSLNIRYHDPADITEGGTWTLVAKTDTVGSNGLAGLAVRFEDIPAAGTVDPNIGHNTFGGNLKILVEGDEVEFTYAQSTEFPPGGPVTGVGQPGGPSDQGLDPLAELNWDNASIIATGTLPNGLRPLAISATANEFDSLNDIVGGTIDDVVVRGDSIASQGQGDSLQRGDINRDFAVNVTDFAMILAGYTGARPPNDPTIVGWDNGNFDDDADVDTADVGYAMSAATLSLLGSPGTPDLFYDPTTGGVTLIPDGANVTSFHITSADQFATPLETTDLDASTPNPATGIDSTTHTMGWISSFALFGDGFGDRPENQPGAFLGNIFPTGLNETALDSLLTSNLWFGPGGTGGAFDLVVASADFDGSGLIDGEDFLQLQLGNTPAVPDNVDLLSLWEATYGSAATATAVPEPATWVLILLTPLLGVRIRDC